MLTAGERARICTAARSYLGVKWLPHGRSKQGIDCTGLMVMAYRDAGFAVEERPDYRGAGYPRLMRAMLDHCSRIDLRNAGPADIVIYETAGIGHVGILLDGNGSLNLIHAAAGAKTAEARFDPKRGNIRGVFTWRL